MNHWSKGGKCVFWTEQDKLVTYLQATEPDTKGSLYNYAEITSNKNGAIITNEIPVAGINTTRIGIHSSTEWVLITKAQNNTTEKTMLKNSVMNIRTPTCKWRSMRYRSLRKSFGMPQHSALLGPGSRILWRAWNTTPHTLNLEFCIVLTSFAFFDSLYADASATSALNPPEPRMVRANMGLARTLGQPVSVPNTM